MCFLLCLAFCVSANALMVVNVSRITNDEYAQIDPSLYAELLVYTEVQNETSRIMLMDLSSGAVQQITNGSADCGCPSIYRDRIVWGDNRSGNWDIYLYNLTSGEEMPIATAEVDESNPGLWEDCIVWSADLYGNSDVFLHNLSTGETMRVTDNLEAQYNPDIWEDRIVFTDLRNEEGDHQVYMYNMTTGEEAEITGIGEGPASADIYEDRVVWDWIGINATDEDIFCTDLSTGEESELVAFEEGQRDPAIWENRVAWSDSREENPTIYIGELVADNLTQSPIEPTPAEGTIVDLIDDSYVDVVATGSTIQDVHLEITNLMDHPVTVHIPLGTVFLSGGASVQDMVGTNPASIYLDAHETESITLDTACLNLRREVPDSSNQFTVQASGEDELEQLLQLLEHEDVPYDVRQAAIWIVTDDADYDDLGMLVTSFSTRAIHEEEAARAMQLVDQAGIPIESRAIWQDRSMILEGLSEEEDAALIEWLNR